MRLVLVLFMSLLLVSCSGNKHNKAKYTVAWEKLKGNVKLVTNVDYKINDSTGTRDTVAIFIQKFDRKGNEILVTQYNMADSMKKMLWIFLYDSTGKLTDRLSPGENSAPSRQVMKYDKYGNCTGSTDYSGGELVARNTYDYDGAGNLVKESAFDTHSKPTMVTTMKYDEQGNETEDDLYNAVKKSHLVTTTKYDHSGNPTEVSYTIDGVASGKRTNKYVGFDKANNWLVQNTYTDGKVSAVVVRMIEYY